MKMVSAAKLRRAQEAAERRAPTRTKLTEMFARASPSEAEATRILSCAARAKLRQMSF